MLRIVICCGGGMSSSVLSTHMQQQIEEKGWQDEVSVDYKALPFLKKYQADYDIAMLCPHLQYYAIQMAEAGELDIPMYVIPARIYGTMDIASIYEDAVDILKVKEHTTENPLHFPGERLLETKRNISHRKWVLKHSS